MSRFGGVLIEEEEEVSGPRFGGILVEEAEKPVEKKTTIDRAMDRFNLGLSDAISSLAGDTYGRRDPEGSPLEPDRRNFPSRMLSAGFDLAQAGGEIVSDVAASRIPDSVKGGLSKAMSSMQETKESHPIYGNSSYIEGAEQLIKPLPNDIKQTIKEAATIAGAASFPKAKFANDVDAGLEKSAEALRRKDIRKKLEPQNIEDDANYGTVVEDGAFNTKRYVPSDAEVRMDEEVFQIEGLDPRRSARHNTDKIEERVEELRLSLDESLVGREGIPVDSVRTRMGEAIENAGASPTMVGDAAESAKKIYTKLDQLLLEATSEAGTIAPGELLKVRRDLDTWIKKNTSKAFDPSIIGANQIATRELRTGINNIINDAVPDAVVAESLRRQSDLLTARDNLTHERLREGGSGLTRAVNKVEGDTGLSPARTPLAFTANISSLPAMLITGVATAASLGARGAVVAGKKLKAQAMKELQSATNAATPTAILAILNSEDNYED